MLRIGMMFPGFPGLRVPSPWSRHSDPANAFTGACSHQMGACKQQLVDLGVLR